MWLNGTMCIISLWCRVSSARLGRLGSGGLWSADRGVAYMLGRELLPDVVKFVVM